jgi:hypothetical protein
MSLPKFLKVGDHLVNPSGSCPKVLRFPDQGYEVAAIVRRECVEGEPGSSESDLEVSRCPVRPAVRLRNDPTQSREHFVLVGDDRRWADLPPHDRAG